VAVRALIARAPARREGRTPAPPGVPGVQRAPDRDENEAEFRAQNPGLAPLDRKQPVQTNEDAVRAVVVAAFGSEQAVEAAFEGLAPEVRTQVDSYIPAKKRSDTDLVAANRVQFFVRMRMYFDSWAELLDHFGPGQIVRVTDGPVDVFLHQDAAARLNRVIAVMKSKNHPLPTIGEGFSLRSFHQGEFQHPGFMVHAMGYAVDVAAQENPKIFTPRGRADPGRHDPVQIAASVSADAMHIKMKSTQDAQVVAAMGTRTAGHPGLSAADDTDPAARDYFQRFEQGFQRMAAGSSTFIESLSPLRRAALLLVRDQYFGVLRAIKAEKAKGAHADAKTVERLGAERRTLLAVIPVLTSAWIGVIDADIAKTVQKHPGIDKLRSPADLKRGIAQAAKDVAKARQEVARSAQARLRAEAARDAGDDAVSKALARERQTPAGPAHDKALAERKAAQQRSTLAWDAVTVAIDANFNARQAVKTGTQDRDALAAELQKFSVTGVQGAWTWLDNLRYLRRLLDTPDLDSAAGLKEYESVTTGDLGRKAPVENPPLLRLLDKGFFNPKGGFDLAFFEEMAHSGFWPGATWEAGSADPMHFELYEGRVSIKEPGAYPAP
jgi:hypothetical protein